VKIEHVALQVSDPVALSRWYVQHLGLTVKRAQTESPFGHFLGDDGDAVMLEFYGYPNLPVPDYYGMEPLLLHVAFHVDDIAATRSRLIGAGAAAVGEVQVNDVGDEVAMLRDPWGIPVQLVRRRVRMIGDRR
jgi:catechol 2,3-dioxygenase-like lactoylglutathione lyase family enzyme